MFLFLKHKSIAEEYRTDAEFIWRLVCGTDPEDADEHLEAYETKASSTINNECDEEDEDGSEVNKKEEVDDAKAQRAEAPSDNNNNNTDDIDGGEQVSSDVRETTLEVGTQKA
ncbi:hypothetical protein KCU81_g9865, partial [Aureobasidium melanogenum]|uniref:Uncharacterized protein n=2 Tax=Aureobasidium melanogenum TaxID=46634 RepID=A0A074VFD6_AURM1